MDYSWRRAAASQAAEDEEPVTVNMRALIDGVLARYPGEWTALRELVQNASDAQSTTVKIAGQTLPPAQKEMMPTIRTISNSGGVASVTGELKHIVTHH